MIVAVAFIVGLVVGAAIVLTTVRARLRANGLDWSFARILSELRQ